MIKRKQKKRKKKENEKKRKKEREKERQKKETVAKKKFGRDLGVFAVVIERRNPLQRGVQELYVNE